MLKKLLTAADTWVHKKRLNWPALIYMAGVIIAITVSNYRGVDFYG